MLLSIAIVVYAAAMVAANLLVAAFGPWVSPINAFLLIGLDLALRDRLHVRLHPATMLLLIVSTGLLTFLLNPAAGRIATASACAFTAAALVDWMTFAALRGRTWMQRSNASNIAGAAVDSLLFPTLAWGTLMPHLVLIQFVAKVVGGAMWAWVLAPRQAAVRSPA